jgi:prolyl-tRNA synthetase
MGKDSKKTKEGLTVKKDENFSEWYTQVLQKAELMDYTKVSGAIVIRPHAYYIWEKIQEHINERIKKLGVKNAYFPMLIPESLLNKEKEHVQGFNPEVAWVTQAGNTKLSERLAIRPTSETIMYDSYKKWIRSYRDLPIKINQWNNVVRWEFTHPVPFLRTREFLWQEGHSAFATSGEAGKEVSQILDIYASVFEDLLAIPVLKGRKTEKEKFAGADYTLSTETFLPIGKAAQGATSHNLGQNFSRAFDISFLDENGKKSYVWQTSWGLSTRSIGIMAAIHGDDKGLVLPPKIASIQVVIVPIIFEKDKKSVLKKSVEIRNKLKSFKVHLDDREDYSSGWKFHEWELKGIPIRIELGPRDIQKKQVILVRRDNGKKETVKIANINQKVKTTLEDIQKSIYNKAKHFLQESISNANNIEEAKKIISKGKIVKANWCGRISCEEEIKNKTDGAKTLNIQEQEKAKGKCFNCNAKAEMVVYIAKSY